MSTFHDFPESDDLKDLYFLQPDENGLANRQGRVISKNGDGWDVELFSWGDGAPNGEYVYSPREMKRLVFYVDQHEWRAQAKRDCARRRAAA